MENTTNITATTTETRKDFETLKRDFETAHAAGGDYSAALLDLSQAVTYSVLNKCLDPQRKTAPARETVSDNGHTPALVEMKRGVYFDRLHLDNTRTAADKATRTAYNDDGDMVTETADKTAAAALVELLGETVSDGWDLVQTAAAAILEQAAEHATGEKWLDSPYTVRRLSRRVYIRLDDSAAYRDETTTPIQEVYKAVRRAVQESRAVQTDPRNGYTYIEELTADGLDTIYLRLGKYADLGGYAVADHSNTAGAPAAFPAGSTHYTADRETVRSYESTLAALALSDRQLTVINLRMRGYGKKAIGAYLGIDPNNVGRVLRQVQAKAEKIGFTPDMWREMTAEN